MVKKLYEILETTEDASPSEIKKAYHKKALAIHPDKHPEDKQKYEEAFKILNNVHEILSDPQKRRQYDKGLLNESGEMTYDHGQYYSQSKQAQSNHWDDAEAIKSQASQVFNIAELKALFLRISDPKLHVILLAHVDFLRVINNSQNDTQLILSYLSKTTDAMSTLISILHKIDKNKCRIILQTIASEQLIIINKETLKTLLNLLPEGELFNKVVKILFLKIMKTNTDIEYINDMSDEKKCTIIQIIANQQLAAAPILNMLALHWNIGSPQISSSLQFNIAFALLGFNPSLQPDILRLDPNAKIEFHEDVGMIVSFYGAGNQPSLKDIIQLQEKEDDQAGRKSFHEYLFKSNEDYEKKSAELQSKMPSLSKKYGVNTAFFKLPDERGMGYWGKGMILDVLKARSFKT